MNANKTKTVHARAERDTDQLPPTSQTAPREDRMSDSTLVVAPTKKGSGTNG